VVAFEKYIGKLHPECDFLFQRPREILQPAKEEKWYCNSRIGKNTIGKLMSGISIAAKLSKKYTNHSIRATSVTLLDTENFDARHIMALSGHKSETSIRSYASRVRDSKRREMSLALSKHQLDPPTVTPDKNEAFSHNPPVGSFVSSTDSVDDEILQALPLGNYQVNNTVSVEQSSLRFPAPNIHHSNVTINYNMTIAHK
jgi:hypothetical protein